MSIATPNPVPCNEPGNAHDLPLATWTAAVAGILILAALAAPLALGRLYTFDDLSAFHLPVRAFYARCLSMGWRFDWMPDLFCGFYLTGEGQVGGYHPLHLALYQWLPLPAAFALELILSYAVMLLGMYGFLMRLLSHRTAALCGAMWFTFSGFCLLHLSHVNAIAIVAHLPWLLWAIDIVLREPLAARRRRVAELFIALLTGSQLLLGYPQYVWFSLLAEGAYVVYLVARRESTLRSCGGLLLAKACGVLLGAVQLLPTYAALAGSTRQAADPSFAFTGSLHPLNLLQLVQPYLFATRVVGQNTHELGLYSGAVPLVLVVWLLSRPTHSARVRALKWPLVGFAAAALLLAMGRFAPLYTLQTKLPLVGSFRFPCRSTVLLHLAIAALAALAMCELVGARDDAGPTRWKRLWALPIGSALLAMVGPFLFPPESLAAAPLMWAGPCLVLTAVLLVRYATRHRWAVVLLIAFSAGDLAVYGFSYAAYPSSEPLTQLVLDTPQPHAQRDHHGSRVLLPLAPDAPGLKQGNTITLAGWKRADGYAGLEPARNLDFSHPEVWQAAGITWIARPAESSDDSTGGQAEWTRVSSPLPRAGLVSRGQLTQNAACDLALVDLAQTALVDRELDLDENATGNVSVTLDRPGRLVVEATTTGRQLLVTTERFDSGWRANADDQPLETLRVNGDFLGCVVPSGRHVVQLTFDPPARRRGAQLSLAGLFLTLVCFLAPKAKRDWTTRSPS